MTLSNDMRAYDHSIDLSTRKITQMVRKWHKPSINHIICWQKSCRVIINLFQDDMHSFVERLNRWQVELSPKANRYQKNLLQISSGGRPRPG